MIRKSELLERLNEMSEPVYAVHDYLMELNRMINEQTGKAVTIKSLDDIEEVAAKLADLKVNIQICGVGGDDDEKRQV